MSEPVLWIHLVSPLGWEGAGNLPTSLPADQNQYTEFMEDLIHFRRKDIILDVGWSLPMQAEGFFVCQVIRVSNDPNLDYGWACPLEEYQTRNSEEVWKWLGRALSHYHNLA